MPRLDLTTFIDELRAPTGAPGGGAASAVAAALGCSLLQMVAGVTLSLPRFTQGRSRLEEIRKSAQELVEVFQDLADEDSSAYRMVESALKMPKDTLEEKAARRKAMQEAFVRATQVPLQVIHKTVEALKLVPDLIEYGNPNAITDVGVGALLLDAARRGAAMNAEINLGSIKDEEFKEKVRRELQSLVEEAQPCLARVKEACEKAGLTL